MGHQRELHLSTDASLLPIFKSISFGFPHEYLELDYPLKNFVELKMQLQEPTQALEKQHEVQKKGGSLVALSSQIICHCHADATHHHHLQALAFFNVKTPSPPHKEEEDHV